MPEVPRLWNSSNVLNFDKCRKRMDYTWSRIHTKTRRSLWLQSPTSSGRNRSVDHMRITVDDDLSRNQSQERPTTGRVGVTPRRSTSRRPGWRLSCGKERRGSGGHSATDLKSRPVTPKRFGQRLTGKTELWTISMSRDSSILTWFQRCYIKDIFHG